MVQIKYATYNALVQKANAALKHRGSGDYCKTKYVAPFSYQSLRTNVIVAPPPRSYPHAPKPARSTLFRKYFLRGDIPVVKKSRAIKRTNDPEIQKQNKSKLNWKIPPQDLDYSYYLPMFFEGLAETEEPYRSLAEEGSHELISFGKNKILPVIPQLIMPLKRALNTKVPEVIVAVFKVIQHLVVSDTCVGVALVPYYRQLLPTCNLFKDFNVNLGERIDRNRDCRVGDVIEVTLRILEQYGGPDAYINIKYLVPTYESFCNN